MPVWQEMRDKRLAMGLTIRGLAKMTGLERMALHNIEKGERIPTEATAQRIFEVLGPMSDRSVKIPRRITAEEVAWAAEERRKGRRLMDVAAELGVKPNSLSTRLRGHGEILDNPVKLRPGNCRCLRCGGLFKSWDVSRNRICDQCKTTSAFEGASF
ncbi:MAG: helix-turn-helix domain-containing protein [Gemmataceae bacterium]